MKRRLTSRFLMLCCMLPLAACASAGLVPEGQSKETSAAAASSQGEARAAVPPAVTAWRMQILQQLESKKRYPAAAPNEEGVVYLSFRVDRRGHLVRSHIVRGSGFASLDNAAQELLRRAQPFSPPPAQVPDAVLNLELQIRYALHPPPPCGLLVRLWGQCRS